MTQAQRTAIDAAIQEVIDARVAVKGKQTELAKFGARLMLDTKRRQLKLLLDSCMEAPLT